MKKMALTFFAGLLFVFSMACFGAVKDSINIHLVNGRPDAMACFYFIYGEHTKFDVSKTYNLRAGEEKVFHAPWRRQPTLFDTKVMNSGRIICRDGKLPGIDYTLHSDNYPLDRADMGFSAELRLKSYSLLANSLITPFLHPNSMIVKKNLEGGQSSLAVYDEINTLADGTHHWGIHAVVLP